MTSKGLLLAVGFASLLLGCASKPKNTTFAERFQKADVNADGKVTQKEYGYSMIEEAFLRYDQNKDGSVTLEEFVAYGGSPASFKQIDKDASGSITLEEAKSAKIALDTMTVNFYAADVDKDGYVTFEEALEYRQKVRDAVR